MGVYDLCYCVVICPDLVCTDLSLCRYPIRCRLASCWCDYRIIDLPLIAHEIMAFAVQTRESRVMLATSFGVEAIVVAAIIGRYLFDLPCAECASVL
jgi:hypothetical protein